MELNESQKVCALLLATVVPAIVVLLMRDALRYVARQLERWEKTQPRGFQVRPVDLERQRDDLP